MTVLLAFGSNGSGQLGLGHCDDLNYPSKVNVPGNDFLVSCGGNHTIIINNSGEAYGSGDNSSHQLGLEGDSYNKFTKLCNELKNKWIFAAALWAESYLIDHEGNIFASGNTTKVFTKFSQFSFTSIPKKVVVGLGHVVVLCQNNDVWAWGSNRKGQIGDTDGSVPKLLASDVKDIACGKDFTIILQNSNSIKILGNVKHLSGLIEFTKSYGNGIVKGIVSSWTSVHIILDSRILSFGNNTHGQLLQPSHPPICNIAAGTEHYLAIGNGNRTVFAWGWGEHGNCGKSLENNFSQVFNSPDSSTITNIYAGYSSSWICLQLTK